MHTKLQFLPCLPPCEQLVVQHLLNPTSRFASSFVADMRCRLRLDR